MRFFTSWSCYSCFDDGISFCNSQLYLNFSSIQSIKLAARQMWNERLSQLVLLQSTFSLPLHIHLWVDRFTLRVVTVAASDITLMCMFVRFLHYHNLSVCVRECVCVCVKLLVNLSETSKLSPPLPLMNELFRCLSWPAFQLRGFTKKHQGMEGLTG